MNALIISLSEGSQGRQLGQDDPGASCSWWLWWSRPLITSPTMGKLHQARLRLRKTHTVGSVLLSIVLLPSHPDSSASTIEKKDECWLVHNLVASPALKHNPKMPKVCSICMLIVHSHQTAGPHDTMTCNIWLWPLPHSQPRCGPSQEPPAASDTCQPQWQWWQCRVTVTLPLTSALT